MTSRAVGKWQGAALRFDSPLSSAASKMRPEVRKSNEAVIRFYTRYAFEVANLLPKLFRTGRTGSRCGGTRDCQQCGIYDVQHLCVDADGGSILTGRTRGSLDDAHSLQALGYSARAPSEREVEPQLEPVESREFSFNVPPRPQPREGS